jgi:hypothetical protein
LFLGRTGDTFASLGYPMLPADEVRGVAKVTA